MILQTRTVYYATPPEDYFWKWNAAYDGVEWTDGRTVTLWAELKPILSYLTNNGGLPPVGSILLILAACRDDWNELSGIFENWLPRIFGEDGISQNSQKMARDLSASLSIISHLPPELRKSLAAKCGLISLVFEENNQRLSFEESVETVNELSAEGPSCLEWGQADLQGITRFLRDAKGIVTALETETVESLEDTLRTGVDLSDFEEGFQGLEPDIDEQRSAGTLMQQLKDLGDDYAVLAGVAEQTIAMIHLPGALHQPDELPVGGVADITNRGPVDRLLPGEMAWDDLTLAVRLIHGEALYFRRELPPEESPRKSAVFLDRGLRIWGIRRLLSIGVAVGITNQPRWRNESCKVFAASHLAWASVELSDIDSIRQAMTDLIPLAGPSDSLRAWWENCRDEVTGDVLFITVPEHRGSPECLRILGDIAEEMQKGDSHLHVVSIAADGSLEMDCRTARGLKKGLRAKIDWEDLVAPEKPAKPVSKQLVRKRNELKDRYPMYRLGLPPFLFPFSPRPYQSLVPVTGGELGVGNGRGILRWEEEGKGARELVPYVPGSRHWIIKDGDTPYLVCSMEAGEPVRTFRILAGELRALAMEKSLHSFPREVEMSGGALLLAYQDSVEAFSIETGSLITNKSIPELPNSPILSFDGHDIHVHERKEGRKATAEVDPRQWNELIDPKGATWIPKVGLHVFDAEKPFRFDLSEWKWKKVGSLVVSSEDDSGSGRFAAVTFENCPGIRFGRVGLRGKVEALHDSRGILHLRRVDDLSDTCISILLVEGQTAVWESDLGLLSLDEALLPRGNRAATVPQQKRLEKKLEGLFLA